MEKEKYRKIEKEEYKKIEEWINKLHNCHQIEQKKEELKEAFEEKKKEELKEAFEETFGFEPETLLPYLATVTISATDDRLSQEAKRKVSEIQENYKVDSNSVWKNLKFITTFNVYKEQPHDWKFTELSVQKVTGLSIQKVTEKFIHKFYIDFEHYDE